MRRDAGGAIAIFDGITRNNFNGKGVDRLEYEAYEKMAKKEMGKICDEVCHDFVHMFRGCTRDEGFESLKARGLLHTLEPQ